MPTTSLTRTGRAQGRPLLVDEVRAELEPVGQLVDGLDLEGHGTVADEPPVRVDEVVRVLPELARGAGLARPGRPRLLEPSRPVGLRDDERRHRLPVVRHALGELDGAAPLYRRTSASGFVSRKMRSAGIVQELEHVDDRRRWRPRPVVPIGHGRIGAADVVASRRSARLACGRSSARARGPGQLALDPDDELVGVGVLELGIDAQVACCRRPARGRRDCPSAS